MGVQSLHPFQCRHNRLVRERPSKPSSSSTSLVKRYHASKHATFHSFILSGLILHTMAFIAAPLIHTDLEHATGESHVTSGTKSHNASHVRNMNTRYSNNTNAQSDDLNTTSVCHLSSHPYTSQLHNGRRRKRHHLRASRRCQARPRRVSATICELGGPSWPVTGRSLRFPSTSATRVHY